MARPREKIIITKKKTFHGIYIDNDKRSRRGTHWVFGSACWEADRCDREKSIWSVTTGTDLLGVCLGLIFTRVRAPPEEQD